MKLSDEQIEDVNDASVADRLDELVVRLTERGKITLSTDEVRAEVVRLAGIARAANIRSAHQIARFIELVLLLPEHARRSPVCQTVIHGVLANVFVPASERVDFLYRHVLPRDRWED